MKAEPIVLLKDNPRVRILTLIRDVELEVKPPYEALDEIKEILRKRK